MQRHGVEVRFAKPIAQNLEDTSVHFAREIFVVPVPEAIPLQDAAEQVASNQTNELMEEIVTLCMKAGDNASVLVVEGLHTDPAHQFTSHMNIDMARALKAESRRRRRCQLTQSGSRSAPDHQPVCTNEGCKVSGAILNMAPEGFDPQEIKQRLGKVPLWGVVQEDPLLKAPRTLDVARHLNAEIVLAGEMDTRRVTDTIITTRSAAAFIPRLRPGTLIIAAGDRDDIVMAVALAASCGAFRWMDCCSPMTARLLRN